MKIRLWRAFKRVLGNPRFMLPYGDTAWITLDEADYVQRAVLLTGNYEPEVWQALASEATSNEIVWDVGANIGTFAIRAALDQRIAEVHAFEPDPITLPLLAFHDRLNNLNLRIHSLALSNVSGHKQLFHGPKTNTGMSTLDSHQFEDLVGFDIDCSTIDELVYQRGAPAPTLLKLDVEGWEPLVLAGARRLLAEQPPKAIVLEAAADESGLIRDRAISQQLSEFGYVIRHIRRPDGTLMDNENYLARRSPEYRP